MFDKYDGVVMVRCRYSFDVKNDRQHAFSHNKTTHNITQTHKGHDITTSPHHNSTGRWGAFLARLLKMLMCMFFLHAADQGMSSRQLQLGSDLGQFRKEWSRRARAASRSRGSRDPTGLYYGFGVEMRLSGRRLTKRPPRT